MKMVIEAKTLGDGGNHVFFSLDGFMLNLFLKVSF